MTNQGNDSPSSSAGFESKRQKTQQEELEYLRRQNSLFQRFIRQSLVQGKLRKDDIPKELDFQAREFQDDTDLMADRESVLEALREGTMRWSTLPESSKWKYDAEVICAVYERDRMVLPLDGNWNSGSCIVEFGFRGICGKEEDGLEWEDLPFQLKMNRDVILHALRAHCGPKLKSIPPRFQTDSNLLSTAILYKKVPLGDIPADILRARPDLALFAVQNKILRADECSCLTQEYLKGAIEEGKIRWEMLPTNLQTDLDFAMTISKFYNDEIPKEMLRHCHQIRYQEAFWRMYAEERNITASLQRYLSQELRSNFNFMAEMCTSSPGAIKLVGDDLSNNPDFIEQAMLRNGNVISYLSHPTQQEYRDLIMKALPNFGVACKDNPRSKSYSVAHALWPEFWSQQDFALAWVRAGLGFPSCIPQEDEWAWFGNRDICLAHALKRKEIHYKFDEDFTKDVSFMLEVVENHPPLYSKAQGAAKVSAKVMAAAFAESPKLAIRTLTEFHIHGQDDKIRRLVEYLQQELEPYEAFHSCILGNMLSTQSVQTTGTSLTLLNQGLEGSLWYKKEFAEYLGIPTGKRLQRLQQARENVQTAIEPWTADSSIFKRAHSI